MVSDTAELRRRLSARPSRVFAAFSDPAMVSRWLKPAPDVLLTVRHFEFREGGTYEFAYQMPNGETMAVCGSFTLIQPPQKLAFTWLIQPPDEHAGIRSIVSVTIEPEGEGSLLVIRHLNLERPDAVSRHTDGWRGAIELLECELQSGSANERE